ncbi:DUF3263 domain-containing protein [Rhodococcus pseudokoreensis]|uniref:DUF3263 domain-containing protein n=1 Tax=Rhodococcus pseudokoreensis TaxID=2811421 RepID=UPI001F1241A3|nr:DUF3263 domain-containing protein [Rhodococcus pseudokoreensis]
MTDDELTMLDFAVKWAPFGGGDDHILPEFGVVPTEFYQRLQAFLAYYPGVNDSVRRRLAELCTLKLRAAPSPARTLWHLSRSQPHHIHPDRDS